MVWRIRDRTTFEELRRNGRRARRGPILVVYLPGPADRPPRVAYAVGRRVGRAVVRNRVRRRLRAVVGSLAPELAPGAYLVSAGPEAVGMGFEELTRTVRAAIDNACERVGS